YPGHQPAPLGQHENLAVGQLRQPFLDDRGPAGALVDNGDSHEAGRIAPYCSAQRSSGKREPAETAAARTGEGPSALSAAACNAGGAVTLRLFTCRGRPATYRRGVRTLLLIIHRWAGLTIALAL